MLQVDRKITRSEGALALRRLDMGVVEVARELGVTHGAVSLWQLGKRTPNDDMKKKIWRRFKIPVSAWDLPKHTAPPPATVPPVADTSHAQAPATVATDADVLMRHARELRDNVLADPDATAVEKIKALEHSGNLLARVAKITGVGSDISEAKILRTPHWERIRTATVAALETEHPAALAVLIEAWKDLT